MRTLRILASLPLLSSFLLACGDGDFGLVQSSLARDTAPNASPAETSDLAKGNTQFAIDLYAGIAKDPAANIFYSPYSISVALGMTFAGAAGDTASQMASALHFTLPSDRLHVAFDAESLALASRVHGQAGKDGAGFQLNVADSIWGDRTLLIQQPFLDTLAVDYGAGVRTVDFIHGFETARASINRWVSDETNQKIQNLLQPGAVDSSTRMVLVNAIYFNAAWDSPFETSATHDESFTRGDGSQVTASNIGQQAGYGYAQGNGWQAVELPYAGRETSMVVLVPDAGKFPSVEASLSSDLIQSVFAGLSQQEVDLSLPKFTVKGSSISLSQQLKSLGMVDAFDPAKANFSALSAQPLYVGDVLHQAFVSVDESGTEAAAATAVVMVGASIQPDVVHLDVNRPFLYFIRDIPTNTILFVGRLVDPTK